MVEPQPGRQPPGTACFEQTDAAARGESTDLARRGKAREQPALPSVGHGEEERVVEIAPALALGLEAFVTADNAEAIVVAVRAEAAADGAAFRDGVRRHDR